MGDLNGGETQDFSPNALNWMNLSWDQSIMILSQKADRSEMDLNLSSNKSNTDSPKTSAKLLIVKQPEEQHRARYLSEGSRGAIKDRSGTSHCTIQLTGYYRPTRVEIFAANGAGELNPHPLYKLIPVSGKTPITTPCQKIIASDGIECLEVTLRPENQMNAVLDCIGILKVCSYDARQQKRQRRTMTSKRQKTINEESVESQIASTSTRICFRAYVLDDTKSNVAVLKCHTEPIRCVQQLGMPEVLKMSLTSASTRGGMDLFIIGRNFDRNTSVLFREYNDDGTIGWSCEAAISKPYFHQCHIVCTIPRYPNLYRGGTVSITVKCGQKSSHPTNFVYVPCEPERTNQDEWAPPASPHFEIQRNQSNNSSWAPPTGIQSTFYNTFNDDSSAMSPASSGSNLTSASKFISTYFDYDSNFMSDYNFDHEVATQNNTTSENREDRSDFKRQRLDF